MIISAMEKHKISGLINMILKDVTRTSMQIYELFYVSLFFPQQEITSIDGGS